MERGVVRQIFTRDKKKSDSCMNNIKGLTNRILIEWLKINNQIKSSFFSVVLHQPLPKSNR